MVSLREEDDRGGDDGDGSDYGGDAGGFHTVAPFGETPFEF